MQWIFERLAERSTWLGLISLATAFGLALSPDQKEAIVGAGLALGGMVAAFTADRK
jgi:hypothetical protein